MDVTVNKERYFANIGYVPHSAGQWAYHNSKARFKAPCCGRRFGKSTMAGRDEEPRLFLPDRRCWIVGPTYQLAEKEFRVMWDDLIVGAKLGADKRVKKAYNLRSGEMYIEFPWRTRVQAMSAQYPQSLVGDSLDHVIMSEAAKHKKETFERYIRAALSDRRGTADFPTTPEGYNWFYDIWQLGQDPDFAEYESWRFPSWENRVIYPGGRTDPEILAIERSTTPEWFMQEIGADFTSFVGQIYSEFDEAVHVKPLHFRPEWPNYMFFDFGFVNPLAAIEVQVSPSDEVFVWREHYKSFMRVEEHCAELKARSQPDGYHLDMAFGDPADPEAVLTVNQYLCPCMGLPECKTNWRQGIDLVKKFLMLRQIGEQDEYGTPLTAPRLWVDPSCKNTIREFNNYRAKEPEKLLSTTRESGSTSAAVKMDDHAMDAIRYGLMHLFELGAQSHLQDVMDTWRPPQPVAPGALRTMDIEVVERDLLPDWAGELALAHDEGFFTMLEDKVF